ALLDCHHIVYRSETRKNVHHIDNLIILCRECHESMHKNKKIRNALIIKRQLWRIYPHLQGYTN
ncbi:MAG: HNH endonuclease, partial [Candidatus Dojkabacteria bacterium]|nr:HNH endonuclease [Candidatus Dojkabacteria bacterium]